MTDADLFAIGGDQDGVLAAVGAASQRVDADLTRLPGSDALAAMDDALLL
jgi:hypothetical protein